MIEPDVTIQSEPENWPQQASTDGPHFEPDHHDITTQEDHEPARD